MRTLGLGQRLEPIGNLGKAFIARRFRHARVHIGVLVSFAGDGGLQVELRLTERPGLGTGRETLLFRPGRGRRRRAVATKGHGAFDFDLARFKEWQTSDPKGKRELILSRLQQRLFEISRRNRLLHFRQTMHSVNLTLASVPLSFDVNAIRPEQL